MQQQPGGQMVCVPLAGGGGNRYHPSVSFLLKLGEISLFFRWWAALLHKALNMEDRGSGPAMEASLPSPPAPPSSL